MLTTLAPDTAFGKPWGLAVARNALYVADERLGCIWRIGPDVCTANESADVVASGLRMPQGLCADNDRIFVCEAGRARVSALDLESGEIEPVWESIPLPSGIDVSGTTLYAASAGVHAVFARDLRCPTSEKPSIVAGVPGSAGNMKHGLCGDGGPARAAQLFNPMDVAVAPSGDVLIADSYNGRIRQVSEGIIGTIAGADQSAPRGNRGRAIEINIGQTRAVALSSGGPCVATCPGVVWQLQEDAEMVPIAGTWVDGNNGDEGDALEIRLNVPSGLAMWGGSLAVADSSNGRVCLVELP